MKLVCVLTFLHINWMMTGANMHWCYKLTVWHQRSQYTVREYIEQNCFQATVSSFLQDTWSRASQISLGLLGKEVFLFFFPEEKAGLMCCQRSQKVKDGSERVSCCCCQRSCSLSLHALHIWPLNLPFLKLFSSVTDNCRTSGCLSFSSSLIFFFFVTRKRQWKKNTVSFCCKNSKYRSLTCSGFNKLIFVNWSDRTIYLYPPT